MLGFFRKQPTDITTLLQRVDEFADSIPAALRGTADPVLASLRSEIKSWKTSAIEKYVSMAREGFSPESFICNYVVHRTADQLESGSLHIYRGVLSTEGTSVKAVFEHAINFMTARGEYTREWADENLRKPVYDGIKRVG